MLNAQIQVPNAVNEPVLGYAPGSPERARLKATLAEMAARAVDIPLVIDGREVRTGRTKQVHAPHRHALHLGQYHEAGPGEVQAAIASALAARESWSRTPWEARAAVFLRAAELLATRHRPVLNAATMLCQSKTAHQAEIDAACELIDFWRFNVQFGARILAEQPISGPGTWNQLDHRPLEGFIYAVTPFNFASIAGNLPTAPALMGNTVLWKPASSTVYTAHYIMQVLLEAGLPPGVINLVPGNAGTISDAALASPDLAGIHFTGSTEVFQSLWRAVGENIARYKTYPRLVGETGGKDFILAHPSADVEALAVGVVRGGFEYQGQKCSAVSRVYVPRSLWSGLRDRVVGALREVRVGDPADFRNFMGAVIDRRAYTSITKYIDIARADPKAKVLHGGYSDAEGFFVQPTLVEVEDPRHQLMCEEIFGPVVTVTVYDDATWEGALEHVDGTSGYALTGAVFARDRAAIARASEALRNAAGNFYINDKPTGAVVGQQPFGGARASGTNDKAGSALNLLRWVSPRALKETFAPPTTWTYPFMGEE